VLFRTKGRVQCHVEIARSRCDLYGAMHGIDAAIVSFDERLRLELQQSKPQSEELMTRLSSLEREKLLSENAPTPAQAMCVVAFHLPFDSGLELWRMTALPVIRHRVDGPPSSHPEQQEMPENPASDAGSSADLILQHYSAKVQASLLRRLPHKIWEATAASLASTDDETQNPFKEKELTGRLIDARVTIWNGGAGLLTVEYELNIPSSCSWVRVSELIDLAHDEMRSSPAWNHIVAEAAKYARQDLAAADPRLFTQVTAAEEVPSSSWCYATTTVAVGRCDALAAQAIAETLVWDGVACDLGTEAPHTVVRVALSASQVTFTEGAASVVAEEAQKVRSALVRMVGVHTSTWRTLQSCEFLLLELIAEWRTGRAERLAALESRIDDLLSLYESMQGLTGTLRHVDVHLSSLDGPLWRTLYDKWGLDEQLNSLDDRLKLLQDLYTNAANAASARRTRWFGNFAFLFTLLSAVSTGLTIVRFIAPDQGYRSRVVTAVISLIAVTSLWLAFWLWQRGKATAKAGR
jgi:hypothetical protein